MYYSMAKPCLAMTWGDCVRQIMPWAHNCLQALPTSFRCMPTSKTFHELPCSNLRCRIAALLFLEMPFKLDRAFFAIDTASFLFA